jgi:hypothetical protein
MYSIVKLTTTKPGSVEFVYNWEQFIHTIQQGLQSGFVLAYNKPIGYLAQLQYVEENDQVIMIRHMTNTEIIEKLAVLTRDNYEELLTDFNIKCIPDNEIIKTVFDVE